MLRAARERKGTTTRGIPEYTTGHISNVENGQVTPSRKFIDLYIERFGADRGKILDELDRLKSQMAQRRADRSGAAPTPAPEPVEITEDSDYELIRSSYEVRALEAYYVVDAAGVIRSMYTIRHLRALRPGVRYYAMRLSYPADSRSDVLRLDPGAGCELAQVRPTMTQYITPVLRLSRELNPEDDEAHCISMSISTSSDVRALPFVYSYGNQGMARASIRLLFAAESAPREVWWFRGTERFAADATPQPHHHLTRNPAGFYHWDFFDLDREYVGLAWR